MAAITFNQNEDTNMTTNNAQTTPKDEDRSREGALPGSTDGPGNVEASENRRHSTDAISEQAMVAWRAAGEVLGCLHAGRGTGEVSLRVLDRQQAKCFAWRCTVDKRDWYAERVVLDIELANVRDLRALAAAITDQWHDELHFAVKKSRDTDR